jgi:transposase
MTRRPTDEFAAFVGLDWADATHDVCLQAAGSQTREFSVLEHQPDTIEAWVSTLRTRFKGPPMARCLELNKGPIVSALSKDDFLVLFPVNPLTLARYREAFTPSHAKDDPSDAALQRELLLTHRDTLTPLNPQSPAIRALEPRVEHRRRLVGDNVRLTHRLTSALKNSFPHVLQWCDDPDTTIFCDFLTQWPTLKAVQLARRSTLERFFRAHHVRYADVIDQRRQAIKNAPPLTTDAGGIAPPALLVQALVRQLRVTLQAIDDFDAAIAQRAQSHPDCPLFTSLPGAGAVLAPRLLAAFGEPRDRYTSADELQKYAGIAPVTERSGNKSWVHWRLPCPTVLRQTFVEWAAESIRHSCWARAYDQQQRHKGTSHQAAVRALAFKGIRILFRCWHNRTPYDESVDLNALERRGSPLIHNLVRDS